MALDLTSLLSTEGGKILLVLFLSFLIGIEREEHKAAAERYVFGGVRTFPLVGFIGYASALLSGDQPWLVAAGFLVVAAFMLVAYRHKIEAAALAGFTSEMSGLVTFLVGALVHYDRLWIATTLVVISVFLLELKTALESLARRAEPGEILTFTKFLLLTAVILPVLPDRAYGPFEINPFQTWVVVVAVSAVSYGSYLIFRATTHGGMVLVGLLGGLYSSTVTTVVLARRSRQEHRPNLFAGSILITSGVMYLRVTTLVGIFNRGLFAMLAPAFLTLAAMAGLVGWIWTRLPDATAEPVHRQYKPKNPLEIGTALLFALLFVAMVVATRLAVEWLGASGVYVLGAIMGVADVDPYVLGMTQSAGSLTPVSVAAAGIVIATAGNNLVKAFYAYAFAERRTGIRALIALAGLALAGLVPFLLIVM